MPIRMIVRESGICIVTLVDNARVFQLDVAWRLKVHIVDKRLKELV